MKKLSFLFISLFVFNLLNAQDKKSEANSGATFTKGTKVFQVGIGLGGDLGFPLGLSFEYGITDKIGLGAYLGYASKTYDIISNKYRVTNILLGARGNYHFYTEKKIDAYAGLFLGYNVASAEWVNSSTLGIPSTYGGFTWAAHLGARYYVSPKVGLFAEIGYGLGFGTLGVAFKL